MVLRLVASWNWLLSITPSRFSTWPSQRIPIQSRWFSIHQHPSPISLHLIILTWYTISLMVSAFVVSIFRPMVSLFVCLIKQPTVVVILVGIMSCAMWSLVDWFRSLHAIHAGCQRALPGWKRRKRVVIAYYIRLTPRQVFVRALPMISQRVATRFLLPRIISFLHLKKKVHRRIRKYSRFSRWTIASLVGANVTIWPSTISKRVLPSVLPLVIRASICMISHRMVASCWLSAIALVLLSVPPLFQMCLWWMLIHWRLIRCFQVLNSWVVALSRQMDRRYCLWVIPRPLIVSVASCLPRLHLVWQRMNFSCLISLQNRLSH